MAYRPISCLEDPRTLKVGRYGLERIAEDDPELVREERAEEDRRARYFERLAEVGLSRPLAETAEETEALYAELAEGVRGR